MRFFAGPTLLVIDELGFLPLPAGAASALFQVPVRAVASSSLCVFASVRKLVQTSMKHAELKFEHQAITASARDADQHFVAGGAFRAVEDGVAMVDRPRQHCDLARAADALFAR